MEPLQTKSKKELDTILQKFINRAQPVFGDKLKRIVLFGSYARGNYDAESDIDLIIMIDEDEDEAAFKNIVNIF